MRALLLTAFVCCGILAMGGCARKGAVSVESRRSPLYSQVHTLFIPAYFAQDGTSIPDWNAMAEVPDEVGYVVVNAGRDWNGDDTGQPFNADHLVHGGPGYLNDPTIASDFVNARIAELNFTGIVAYGYVDFYYGRPQQQIQDDIDAWFTKYNVGGIFFDDAARASGTQGGIGKARYFAPKVRDPGLFRLPIFNWGGISNYTEGFVYCTYIDNSWIQFVTAETDEFHYFNDQLPDYNFVATYNTQSLQDWLFRYSPWRFIHIVHHQTSNGSMVGAFMAKAAERNAQQVYMTDLPNPNDQSDPDNPWKYLSGHNHANQFDIFWNQVGQVQTTRNYPGISPDSPRVWPGGTCPAPTPTEGGPGT